jgi:hypothetical protein
MRARNLAAFALLALVGGPALARAIGLHVVSHHFPDSVDGYAFNNNNQGLYYIDDNGFTVGQYQNSYGLTSQYAGYTAPEWHSWTITIGAITGYRDNIGTPSLMVVPSVRAFTLGDYTLRIAIVPKTNNYGATALHIMLEKSF